MAIRNGDDGIIMGVFLNYRASRVTFTGARRVAFVENESVEIRENRRV